MKKSGTANLPLHHGHVPRWLSERMARLGLAITECILQDFGKRDYLRRMADPFWFQSLGCVMGMDWHSSGITTSVLGALKRSVSPLAKELGIQICGGKGKHSRNTPQELEQYCMRVGLNGNQFARASKLVAKVDNTAVQDGYQLYLHTFIVSDEGDWTVVQQGMNETDATARRYHWHSNGLTSFTEQPHSAICGKNQGKIINMTADGAAAAKATILNLCAERPSAVLTEASKLVMPNRHEITASDIDLKRLGAMLWLTHEKCPADFEELLLLKGMGPRTLQSLALVSEIIYGTPARFEDPARFSFAHGGKDGHPFPVLTKVYDETIDVLNRAVGQAKLGDSDKKQAIKALSDLAYRAERHFTPHNDIDILLKRERDNAWKHGGKTVFGDAPPPSNQLKLFDWQ
ncbi:hypothetical protein SAMN05421747_11368 [Parapedobacter composti]|uniref:DUF763 domain-containing protein n=1 Tax=Parapedobacter composti TaxID=623281 RepID=A0A1I1JV78_9SPHI|nr:DUF763 domain-containing protein [Parapedobacter composti]SFC52275.1 hypothetical protein SAMN05421747_11368 [Parapedobacter composti]